MTKTEQLRRYRNDLEAKLKVVEKAEQHTGRFNVSLGLMPMPNQYWQAAKGAVILELRKEIREITKELADLGSA